MFCACLVNRPTCKRFLIMGIVFVARVNLKRTKNYLFCGWCSPGDALKNFTMDIIILLVWYMLESEHWLYWRMSLSLMIRFCVLYLKLSSMYLIFVVHDEESGWSRLTLKLSVIDQRIINMNRNGNSANLFSYVCNDKKIKELFASSLNRITASVRCVSSIIVVLNAKLIRLIAVHANRNPVRNKKARRECRFLLVETHKHLTFITVFTVHAKASILYTFQQSMQANRNINLW